jgi:urease accessory protein
MRAALAALGLALTAPPAFAHPVAANVGGVLGGALHPLLVTEHSLAILGLGLLIGQQTEWARPAPFTFIVVLAPGLLILTLGVAIPFAGIVVLLCALVAGVLVALARPLPEALGCVLAGLAGLAIALDSPPQVVSVREANLMLIGTGFGATILLIVVVEVSARLRPSWTRIGARVFGSWIAASAILLLALPFAR